MVWPIFGDHQLKLNSINRIMSSPDDLVVAIIGGAMLEEAVERTLIERMRQSDTGYDRLFEPTKPLSSTSAQIDALYMLWGLEPHVRKSMLELYRVRNFFAHNLAATFESKEKRLIKALNGLKLHLNLTHYPDARFGTPTSKPIEPVKTNRDKFIVNLKLCLNYLMQDRCKHISFSTVPISHDELRKQVGEPAP